MEVSFFLVLSVVLAGPLQAAELNIVGINVAPRSFQEEAAYWPDLGVGTIRINLPWDLVEPKPYVFDWAKTDAIVREASSAKVHVLFTLRSISSWGTKKETRSKGNYHSSSAPIELSRWADFTRSLAMRYKGKNVSYEIENEINAKAFWAGTIEEYLELLKTSYKAIKAADPDAVVLASAMACGITRNLVKRSDFDRLLGNNHDRWLMAVLKTKAFDVVSVHDYYFPSEVSANGLSFSIYLERVKRLMKEAGVADKPVWITEAGYISRNTRVGDRVDQASPEKQAFFLRQAYAQARSAGVERMFWLLLKDRDEAYFGSMGLIDTYGQKRLAWESLANIARE